MTARPGQPPLALRVLVHAVVWLVALTMLAPFIWMVLTSLKTEPESLQPTTWRALLPRSPQWGNYVRAVREAELGRFYANSLVVAAATTLLAVAHNLLAGYAFCKLRFAGRRILFGLTLATMMLPIQVFFIFAYLIAAQLGYVDNLQALIVPFLASGFGVFYMRQAVSAVPDSLLEAGRLDGMRELDLLWSIVRPIVWPAVTALAIFSFMNSWNAFFWPLIAVDSVQHKTLPLAIADLSAGMYVQSWPVQMAAATVLVLPLVLVFFLAQRAFIRGVAMTGLKE